MSVALLITVITAIARRIVKDSFLLGDDDTSQSIAGRNGSHLRRCAPDRCRLASVLIASAKRKASRTHRRRDCVHHDSDTKEGAGYQPARNGGSCIIHKKQVRIATLSFSCEARAAFARRVMILMVHHHLTLNPRLPLRV